MLAKVYRAYHRLLVWRGIGPSDNALVSVTPLLKRCNGACPDLNEAPASTRRWPRFTERDWSATAWPQPPWAAHGPHEKRSDAARLAQRRLRGFPCDRPVIAPIFGAIDAVGHYRAATFGDLRGASDEASLRPGRSDLMRVGIRRRRLWQATPIATSSDRTHPRSDAVFEADLNACYAQSGASRRQRDTPAFKTCMLGRRWRWQSYTEPKASSGAAASGSVTYNRHSPDPNVGFA